MSIEERNPTVYPTLLFISHADVDVLRKALKVQDEDTLINTLCRRSNEQRSIIQNLYKIHFARDLIADVRAKINGNLEKLLVALLTPATEYLARELHDAIYTTLGTDEDAIIEILCPRSNAEINAIKDAYQKLYETDLESDLEADGSSNYIRRLIISLCSANRNESANIDPNSAMLDAKALLKTGAKKSGIDENTFGMIFCQRSFAQIKLVCEKFHEIAGHSLEHAIQKDYCGNIKDGMKAIVQCSNNRIEFFAHRLHKCAKGSTNDSQLIRLIVSRSEIDMQDIKDTFERLYLKTLRSWIQSDTSGSYKKTLYILIGEEKKFRA